MSEEELDQGKQWVVQTIKQYAQTMSVPIKGFEWGMGNDERPSLVYYVNGKRYIERFESEELQDAPNHKSVRTNMEERIKKLVESFQPKSKKIGF